MRVARTLREAEAHFISSSQPMEVTCRAGGEEEVCRCYPEAVDFFEKHGE